MKGLPILAAFALALPAAAPCATRTYETDTFGKVAVSAGITADIRVGLPASVVADTQSADFDDLRITVEGEELRIGRPELRWFSFGRRPRYHVAVTVPALRSLQVSSSAKARVEGSVEGDFSVRASSGSEAAVLSVRGGNVKAAASSGADIGIAGNCVSLEASASSGAKLDAGDLQCESVAVQASSGADIEAHATKRVTGSASSGADIEIHGAPPDVQVSRSSGAGVEVGK